MNLPMHADYQRLADKAATSHEQGRRSDLLSAEDIQLARLYSYAFRTHSIGAFHATRQALEDQSPRDPVARVHLQRAVETLVDLANQGTEPPANDFRVVISTFYRYDRHIRRVLDALNGAHAAGGEPWMSQVIARFTHVMGRITGGNGITPTRDLEPDPQASFVVPNLGITIVPLVYGDHHSWNMAYLKQDHLDVPMHMHRSGVEIHLGFPPLSGHMVLGDCKAEVSEGYAMPIPPMTRHGWVNTSGQVHHVPFIFGSLKQSGWGVFLDVEAQPLEVDELRTVQRDDWRMGATAYLQRQIDASAKLTASTRRVIVPATAMDRNGSGGLELAVSRINASGMNFATDSFRIVSVVSGRGQIRIGPAQTPITAHDHTGIPEGMTASMRQDGDEPLVVRDTLIRGRG